MAKEKPGVMVYWEMFDVLESLMDGQAKIMLQAIRSYSQYGIAPDFTGDALLATLWMLVKPKIDADSDRYEKIRRQRTDAINARWSREREKDNSENGSIQPYTDEYESIRNIPTTSTTAPSSTTATPTPDTSAETNKGIRGNEEMDKGLTLVSQSECAGYQPEDVEFEIKRRAALEKLLG